MIIIEILLYIILILFGILVPLMIAITSGFYLLSHFSGAPYVPTSHKIVDEILARAKLKKGQRFIELGSGDGRITMRAVEQYGVVGLGVDIHPLLIWQSRLMVKFKKLNNIEFKMGNFYNTDLKDAKVIFLFLLPATLVKLKPKLLTAKKSLIISHGFKIKGWDRYLIDTIERKQFPTYYYIVTN